MELTALAIFLITTPHALPTLATPAPRADFTTIDGLSVSYAEGTAALSSGQAMLVGDLLVGTFATLPASSYRLPIAA